MAVSGLVARRGDRGKGPWPAPVVDRIEPEVAKLAERYPAWGHELVDNYRTPADTNAADANTSDHTPAEPTDGEAADHTPAGPADGKADHAQNNLTVPLNAVLGPRYETTISGSLDTNNRAPTPPRAPP